MHVRILPRTFSFLISSKITLRYDGLERLSTILDDGEYEMAYSFQREFLEPETLDIVDVIVSDSVYEGSTTFKLFFDFNPEEYVIKLSASHDEKTDYHYNRHGKDTDDNENDANLPSQFEIIF